ncbi:RodZ family helix-turn-helix domain-containing protein [Streptomyces pharetrae]
MGSGTAPRPAPGAPRTAPDTSTTPRTAPGAAPRTTPDTSTTSRTAPGTTPRTAPAAAPAAGAATHDPHEVTVQLDAVQLGDGMLRQVAAGVPDASDAPVFVDETGRRVRRFRRIGMAVGLVCAAFAVVTVATLLSGDSEAPALPVPEQNADRPASQVDSPPLDAESAPPSAPDSDGAPGSSAGTTPTQGAVDAVPDVPTAPADPGSAVQDPAPTATGAVTGPGFTPSGTGAPAPSQPPADPAPDPTPADDDPSTAPSPITGGGNPGNGVGTDRRPGRTSVDSPLSAHASSPEHVL